MKQKQLSFSRISVIFNSHIVHIWSIDLYVEHKSACRIEDSQVGFAHLQCMRCVGANANQLEAT